MFSGGVFLGLAMFDVESGQCPVMSFDPWIEPT